MWTAVGVVIMAGAAAAAGLRMFWAIQGDCDITLEGSPKGATSHSLEGNRLRVIVPLSVSNLGKQQGRLLEILPRLEYVENVHQHLVVGFRIQTLGLRQDGYWSATAIAPGGTLSLRVVCDVSGPSLHVRQLLERPVLPLVFHCKIAGRTGMFWRLFQINAPLVGSPGRVEGANHPGSHAHIDGKR